MTLPSFLLKLVTWLFSALLFHVSIISASSFKVQPFCHANERSALLKFKQSLSINVSASKDPSAYAKVESWKVEQSNCCFWDGVKCDKITGHVVSLDLSNSCLYGSMTSNSGLFELVHLRKLNLAYNHFNYSLIPSKFGLLSRLTYLNLSSSSFFGQVPANISQLSKLSFLDFSKNDGLILKQSDFMSLAQNFSLLETLDLSMVQVPSVVPEVLVNFSSLRFLLLPGCGLYDEFPTRIFQLPNLRRLDLALNQDLNGHLPTFNSTSPLKSLFLSRTSFSGKLPTSIGNLGFLKELSLVDCSFYGQVPDSLRNLTHLVYLDLSRNEFESQNFSSFEWVGKLTNLNVLGFSSVNSYGQIPAYIANLTLSWLFLVDCQINQIPSWLLNMTQLMVLDLSSNELQGPIPDSISQLSQLFYFDLTYNKLQGSIPSSMFELKNLKYLFLGWNNLSGTVDLNMFLKLKNLTDLHLSGNKLSVQTLVKANGTIQKFNTIGFGSCNLGHFPSFLHDQDRLEWLDLSHNNIHGQVPKWLWNTSKDTLRFVNLSNNFLICLEEVSSQIKWEKVEFLYLHSNMMQGPLPIPPPSIMVYTVSKNNFTGEISSTFCGLNSIYQLDLSYNNLSGVIPQCLGYMSVSLELLNLGGNNFHGKIPQTHRKSCNLRMLILGYNHLDGKVPRSLAHCTRLEFLDLGNNQINDVFPSWLGALQELKVFILGSNQFYGYLGSHLTRFELPSLQIVDLSHNNFSGPLPIQFFLSWNAMKELESGGSTYMQANRKFFGAQLYVKDDYMYSMIMNNKGTKRVYGKILEQLFAIDLSANSFQGNIPEILGELKALRSLNLSNNLLDGPIPSSLGNLLKLESLDLSQNKLSREIPQELTQLNFLAFFNVSYNYLTGPIPHGKQFDTFEKGSYVGNSGLCGSPLSKECGDFETSSEPPALEEHEEDRGSLLAFDWRPVVIGYATGLTVGLVVGSIVISRKKEWLAGTSVIIYRRKRRVRQGQVGNPGTNAFRCVLF